MICCDGPEYICEPSPGPGPGPSPGPVGSWRATLLWEHSPGFFSCERFQGETLLGTYDTCLGFKAQLCHLESRSVLHTFDSSESVYHLRNINDNYCYVACEQGNLWAVSSPTGAPYEIEHQHYHMGYYDALDYDWHRYSLEKENVYPPNKVAIRRDGVSWVHSTNWKAKDMIIYNGSLYLSATGVDNDIKAAIVRVDISSKTQHFYKKFHGWTGGVAEHNGRVWVTLTGAKIYNTAGEEWKLSGNSAWFIGEVNGVFLTTTSEGDWRGYGPSYLYEFDEDQYRWIKVLTFNDAEPWYICPGASADKFIFVTRNEHEWCGKGRVYELTRN